MSMRPASAGGFQGLTVEELSDAPLRVYRSAVISRDPEGMPVVTGRQLTHQELLDEAGRRAERAWRRGRLQPVCLAIRDVDLIRH